MIYALLAFLGLLGVLPLAIVLYKTSYARRMIKTGIPTQARVYRIYRTTLRVQTETVAYTYYGIDRKQYYGSFKTGEIGKYLGGQVIQVYSDPPKPKFSTVDGAWGSPVSILLGILIALVCLYAVYDLYNGIQAGIF